MEGPSEPASQRRAFVLTDVVDSLQLAQVLGDVANGALWDAHDREARALLARFGGTELERTDGLMVLFDEVEAAVGFVLAYHEALRRLDPPLVARAGVHLGSVVARANPAEHVARGAKALEVDGLALAITSRTQSVAQGGQTLLTAPAREALSAPGGLRIESHGHWQMKGLDEPVELFEVGGDRAPFLPPVDGAKVYRVVRDGDLWLPARGVRHTLPRERDPFVGRAADLAALARRLDEGAALVSVLGIGGTGKTRLVTRYAWRWLGDYPGGAWFCDLADARDADGVVAAVARGLEVPLGADPVTQLGHALAGRGRCLVVFDNFEQVARHAADTLGRWLDRAPEARFVVTTREILGLPGESALPLAPLDAADASALFVARARQAGAEVRDEDAPVVAELVRMLDQLPLAIELAAARARVMPAATLLERMSQRFRLLAASGARHTRQATLRATLDWSWDLLSPAEQAALAQLSVFDTFTLASAEAVLDVGDAWAADVVQALVDKSLVRTIGRERFGLLVSVQEYAAERLGPDRAAVEARHGAHFASYGRRALDWPTDAATFAARGAARGETGNLVLAFERGMARGDAATALGAAVAAWEPLVSQRHTSRLALVFELVALRERLDPVDRVRATRLMAMTSRLLGRPEARGWYDEALAGARALGMRRDVANLLNGLGMLELAARRYDTSRAYLEAALALDREDAYPSGQGLGLHNLGQWAGSQGRHDEMLAHAREAVALHQRDGDRVREVTALGNLAAGLVTVGRDEEAGPVFDRALEIGRTLGDRRTLAGLLINLGLQRFAVGRHEGALALGLEARDLARELGDRQHEATSQLLLALGLARLGSHAEARAAAEAGLALRRELGDPVELGVTCGDAADVERRAGRLERARSLVDEGLALVRGSSDRSGLGHLLATKVRVSVDLGDRDAAEAAWAELTALVAGMVVPPTTQLGRHVAAAERALRLVWPAADAP